MTHDKDGACGQSGLGLGLGLGLGSSIPCTSHLSWGLGDKAAVPACRYLLTGRAPCCFVASGKEPPKLRRWPSVSATENGDVGPFLPGRAGRGAVLGDGEGDKGQIPSAWRVLQGRREAGQSNA